MANPYLRVAVVAHLVVFSAIGVVDFYSDFAADVCYQIIGITLALFRFVQPDSSWLPELLNFRIATRVLRPYSLWFVVQSRLLTDGLLHPKTLFGLANTMHDTTLVVVGLFILFRLARLDLARAVYRESWFVMACMRLVISLQQADPVATASCVLEIVATNCLLFVLITGGRVVPARVVGVLGACVGCQKLWYLTN